MTTNSNKFLYINSNIKKQFSIQNLKTEILERIKSLSLNDVIVVCVIVGTVFFLILSYKFPIVEYFTKEGIKTDWYNYKYINTSPNYILGIAGFIISFGISYLFLNSKRKK